MPTVSGTKFHDRNANGVRDPGEEGLSGWTMVLRDPDGGTTTTTTDGSGNYSFGVHTRPGTYSVTENGQAGWTQSVGPGSFSIPEGVGNQNFGNNNFGNFQRASIAGEKYDDTNGNGARDSGEPTLSGWTIKLDGADGMGNAVHLSQATDGSGQYSFGNLVPGHYTVSEVLQSGWTQSEPASGTYVLDPQSGDNITGKRFGNLVLPDVHGMKFQDMAENHTKDVGDGGLGGWQVTLTGTDGMGRAVSLTTTTAADGTYSFIGVWPGTAYTVCETNPDALRWFQTYPGGDGCNHFSLVSHQVQNDVDFGNYDRSSIAGIKYSDHHKDGARTSGDETLDGWTVTLTDCNGNAIPQAATGVPTLPGQTSDPNPQVTSGGGAYLFGGLHNGTYCVDETQQFRWVETQPCLDPAPMCGYSFSDSLSGTHRTAIDFGNFQLPGNVKVPDGNAANADPSVPKANLWLCQGPTCTGPGEGRLRVVEHVTNVHTGDQNGDSIEDGLGAYEFAVEYDNLVIQSVNPCDIVFGPGGAGAARGPVDELNSSSPANADCAPDPGNAGTGTCALSFVLENLIRFGCVTNGQAAGPTGDFDLASLVLVPHPDLTNDIFPGNNNGVLTVLKDNGCELVDVFGHPAIGSVNGGQTPVCGDLAVTVRILEGDMNLDCIVDVTDEQLISFRYGAFFGDVFYQKWFDLEPALHDLDIDIKDLQKVFGRDTSTCQAPIPEQPPLDPPAPFGD